MSAKIKDEIWDEIASNIEQGLVQRQAYELAGINKATYYLKLKSDLDYLNTIKSAIQKFKKFHLKNITNHAIKDWHASAWLLERIYSDEYAKVEKHEQKEVDEFSGMSEKEIDEELAKYNK